MLSHDAALGATAEVWMAMELYLKQRVNERGDGGALCEDDEQSEEDQEHHDRAEPPFFSNADEFPEFFYDGQFCHGAGAPSVGLI